MAITSLLYIILGLSIGVGASLIYLQERFTRDRRSLIALHESDKVKSAGLLKDLDTKWEKRYKKEQEKNDRQKGKITELEEALLQAETHLKKKVATVPENPAAENSARKEIDSLTKTIENNDIALRKLQQEKDILEQSLQESRQEIENLHGETTFLQGEIRTLKESASTHKPDDDFLILAPGNHYIPGSVARKLMGKE